MTPEDAWFQAAHTDSYSSVKYENHPYSALRFEQLKQCRLDAEAGISTARLIYNKYLQLRLKG